MYKCGSWKLEAVLIGRTTLQSGHMQTIHNFGRTLKYHFLEKVLKTFLMYNIYYRCVDFVFLSWASLLWVWRLCCRAKLRLFIIKYWVCVCNFKLKWYKMTTVRSSNNYFLTICIYFLSFLKLLSIYLCLSISLPSTLSRTLTTSCEWFLLSVSESFSVQCVITSVKRGFCSINESVFQFRLAKGMSVCIGTVTKPRLNSLVALCAWVNLLPSNWFTDVQQTGMVTIRKLITSVGMWECVCVCVIGYYSRYG